MKITEDKNNLLKVVYGEDISLVLAEDIILNENEVLDLNTTIEVLIENTDIDFLVTTETLDDIVIHCIKASERKNPLSFKIINLTNNKQVLKKDTPIALITVFVRDSYSEYRKNIEEIHYKDEFVIVRENKKGSIKSVSFIVSRDPRVVIHLNPIEGLVYYD